MKFLSLNVALHSQILAADNGASKEIHVPDVSVSLDYSIDLYELQTAITFLHVGTA